VLTVRAVQFIQSSEALDDDAPFLLTVMMVEIGVVDDSPTATNAQVITASTPLDSLMGTYIMPGYTTETNYDPGRLPAPGSPPIAGRALGGVPNYMVADNLGRATMIRLLNYCPLEVSNPLMLYFAARPFRSWALRSHPGRIWERLGGGTGGR